MTRVGHSDASVALAQLDPVMSALVATHGPMRIAAPPKVEQRFERLAESIVYQQLAGRAAATIWGRVRDIFGPGSLKPQAVLLAPIEQLRAAGLSRAKAAAIIDLAHHVDDGRLELTKLGRMSDSDIIDELIAVRGIGPWTAQMFLMFALGRLDVWPTGDLGVRNGYGIAYRLADPPSSGELAEFGNRFRPYRSVAAWYCWKAADSPSHGDSVSA